MFQLHFQLQFVWENTWTPIIDTTYWLISVFIIARKADMVVTPGDNIKTEVSQHPPNISALHDHNSLCSLSTLGFGHPCKYSWLFPLHVAMMEQGTQPASTLGIYISYFSCAILDFPADTGDIWFSSVLV